MKEKLNTEKLTDSNWEEIASALSGETDQSELVSRFLAEDRLNAEKEWKGLRIMDYEKEINVDKAWSNVHERISRTGTLKSRNRSGLILMRSSFLKIAAAALVLVSIGGAAIYLVSNDSLHKKIAVATGNDQKNLKVTLPDGSDIYLNRNTELSYRSGFGKRSRNVILSGEAFFEIKSDASRPFIIDAGKANIKVVGTSFNVITNNSESAVEVFVKTGQVVLSDNSGNRNLMLEPGFIGTMDSRAGSKSLNKNPNYLSWKTGLLVYDGQKLNIVFRDLKRVYNMDIVADDPEILNETWTSSIDNQTQDTIIRLICASFNLSFSNAGNVYHLSRK